MVQHAARDHSRWSASSTERNWHCSGALTITLDLPETTSEAADWGTCAHQLSEKCLAGNVDAVSFIGTVEKAKKHEFEVDEEMADTAQMYVDYVRKRQADYKAETSGNAIIFLEEKFSLEALKPPFEAGGTADCVLIFPVWKLIEVIDLKGGRGVVVEAKGNPQGRTYALGAMLRHQSAKVERIKVTIVQPRAGHRDGRIRSEEFHVADLVEWTTDLMQAMARAHGALVSRQMLGKAGLTEAMWSATHLKAGGHCKFCGAAGFCPALEQKALDAAAVWFDDLDQPRISNSPDAMSPEKLAQTLDLLDMIESWANSVRAHAHRQAESGIAIPGYQLVEKIGNRAWKLEEADIVKALEAKGVPHQHLWQEPKLKSPAMIEKTIGAKRKGEIADLVERPIRGTNLVAVTKSTRPAATPSVHKHLDDLDAPTANVFD